MTSVLAGVAISSPLQSCSTIPLMYLISFVRLSVMHQAACQSVCPQSSQSHSRTPLSIFKCFLSFIQPLSNILRKGVLILKRQEPCVRNCTLIQGASITSVLAFPISQVATKYAIRSSRAALPPKTSAISMQKSRRKYVLFSRASLTFCHL